MSRLEEEEEEEEHCEKEDDDSDCTQEGRLNDAHLSTLFCFCPCCSHQQPGGNSTPNPFAGVQGRK